MEEHPYTKPSGRTAPFITAPNCAPSSVSWPDRVCPWHVASGVSLRLDMPDERLRQLLATTRVLRDGDGQAQGVVLVLHDVTEPEAIRDQLGNRRGIHGIIGRHRTMQEIYELVEQLADSDATVLVLGESGTGKELVALAIHHSSHRRAGSFVKVNCAALSESLLGSELFGHVKGAFTGALCDKVGRFELAQAGTIFLDEIGDVSLAVPVKLLRGLQERQIERVGSSETVDVDCCVIAATKSRLDPVDCRGSFLQRSVLSSQRHAHRWAAPATAPGRHLTARRLLRRTVSSTHRTKDP